MTDLTQDELDDLENERIDEELSRIPSPPDAIDIEDWELSEDPSENTYCRWFKVWTRTVGPEAIEVSVSAEQVVRFDADWNFTGDVGIRGWYMSLDDALPHDTARQLAAALLEAADQLETRLPPGVR